MRIDVPMSEVLEKIKLLKGMLNDIMNPQLVITMSHKTYQDICEYHGDNARKELSSNKIPNILSSLIDDGYISFKSKSLKKPDISTIKIKGDEDDNSSR